MSNNRSRNNDGEFRKKRGDTKVQNLKETYPEFNGINGNTHLKTLKEKFNTDSLDGVLKNLKQNRN
ncbi:MAG: hypothetical protein JST70_04850 [Bacteroidetes bacterium]|nr:hypothetical protein [Bacteroidota bacterium]